MQFVVVDLESSTVFGPFASPNTAYEWAKNNVRYWDDPEQAPVGFVAELKEPFVK